MHTIFVSFMIIEVYDYFLFFFYSLFFFWLTKRILKKNSNSKEYKFFLYAWFFKIAACLLYSWMIVYYYGYGDPIGYYQFGNILRNAILDDVGNLSYLFQSGSEFKQIAYYFSSDTELFPYFGYYDVEANYLLHKLVALLSFFTFNRFLIISLCFALIGFWGQVFLYKALKKLNVNQETTIAISCLFIPSFLFWSSGLAKEPVAILASGVLFYYIVSLFVKEKLRFKQTLIILLAGYFLFVVKNYIFACLILSLIIWFLYNSIEKLSRRDRMLKFTFMFLIFIVAAIEVVFLWNSIQGIMVENVAETISTNLTIYRNVYEHQAGGQSLIEVANFDKSDAASTLAFIPQGLVNVFFRPWPWEVATPLMALTVLENMFFLFLFIKTLINTKLFFRGTGLNKQFQVFILTFSLSLALIIGASTFNFGTLVRYRIPFLPFWLFFLLIKGMPKKVLPDDAVQAKTGPTPVWNTGRTRG